MPRATESILFIRNECAPWWQGRAIDDDGNRVRLDGLVGWAEEARNLW